MEPPRGEKHFRLFLLAPFDFCFQLSAFVFSDGRTDGRTGSFGIAGGKISASLSSLFAFRCRFCVFGRTYVRTDVLVERAGGKISPFSSLLRPPCRLSVGAHARKATEAYGRLRKAMEGHSPPLGIRFSRVIRGLVVRSSPSWTDVRTDGRIGFRPPGGGGIFQYFRRFVFTPFGCSISAFAFSFCVLSSLVQICYGLLRPCDGFVTPSTPRSPNVFNGCYGVTAPAYYIPPPSVFIFAPSDFSFLLCLPVRTDVRTDGYVSPPPGGEYFRLFVFAPFDFSFQLSAFRFQLLSFRTYGRTDGRICFGMLWGEIFLSCPRFA